jgi:hypothetical protein
MLTLLRGDPQIAFLFPFLFAGMCATAQTPTQASVAHSAVPSKSSSAAANAPVDGTWEGVLEMFGRPLRIVVHIAGPANALSATADSPDQDRFGRRVDTIAFTAPTLTFEMTPIDARFNGNLLSDGTISGTFLQHGMGVPLVLARSAGVVPPASGSVTDGHYHQDQTGIEFDVPAGFTVISTTNYADYNGWLTTLGDANNRHIISAWMAKRRIAPNNIGAVLDKQVPAKITRRKNPENHYEIPPEGVQQTAINGQQAVKATAYYTAGGKKSAELLTWIQTEHSVIHFYSMVPVESLADVQASFDQMVATARVP